MKFILSLSLIALAFAPGVAPQDEFSETNPCPIPVTTGRDGMYFERPSAQTYNVTAGDWMYLDMFNEFDVTTNCTSAATT
jgi:hypothetical protein